jgi:hypothetical protein
VQPLQKSLALGQFSLRNLLAVVGAIAVLLAVNLAGQHATGVAAWRLLAVEVLIGIWTLHTYWTRRRAELGKLLWWHAMTQTALCLYLPFSWVVLMSYPWNSYHLHWLKLLPVLPGFLPAAFAFHANSTVECCVAGVITATLMAALTWLTTKRGDDGVLSATTIALAISLPTSLLLYGAFWA